jgi:hypothetical protein
VLLLALVCRALLPLLSDIPSDSRGFANVLGCTPRDAAGWASIVPSNVERELSPEVRGALAKVTLFEQFTRELQRVRLVQLRRKDMQVFFLNIYNAMVEHGFARLSCPVEKQDVASFRNAVVYRIGQMDFSLDLVYHVVFRANERPTESWVRRVGGGDVRALLSRKPDPRILLLRPDAVFPIPVDYVPPTVHPIAVDRQINTAVRAFCKQFVRVDSVMGKVSLPTVFWECWNIFGGSQLAVVTWLQQFLGGLAARPAVEWTVCK